MIRADLHLSYAQIGILLSLPGLFASLVEPVLGIYSDLGHRRVLILGGGLVFGLALALSGLSQGFGLLLIATMLMYPASGAFVSLSQTALMDMDPERHEQNMARWTLAGSVGVLAGPLVLSGAVALGLDWRGVMIGLAVPFLIMVAGIRRVSFAGSPAENEPPDQPLTLRGGLRSAGQALRQREVQRWLFLLQMSDLMLDILYSFLALYFVDEVGVSAEQAGLAVALWTAFNLVGDVVIIPVLERVRGLFVLRLTAGLMLIVFPAFLLVPSLPLKLVLLGAVALLNAGWYAILQARLYSALPGQSGIALAVTNIGGLAGSLIPLALGIVAQATDLRVAMWLLLLGPLALVIGLRNLQDNHLLN